MSHNLLNQSMFSDFAGGGGGGDRHTDQNNGSLRVYFGVQIPPFIDWTCAGEECGATAEITQSFKCKSPSRAE